MKKRIFFGVVAVIFALTAVRANAQCFASGDADGDGSLSVADVVEAVRFITQGGSPPTNLYELDLNGDCRIDELDLDVLNCVWLGGIGCVPQWPVPTCCNPDTVRGACCMAMDSCRVRSPFNCPGGYYYHGNGTRCNGSLCPAVCGDVDDNGSVSIADAVFMITCIFACSPGPWLVVGDVNCDRNMSIADVVYLINYIFAGGAIPCANCGQ